MEYSVNDRVLIEATVKELRNWGPPEARVLLDLGPVQVWWARRAIKAVLNPLDVKAP